jgi:hypothetical protein
MAGLNAQRSECLSIALSSDAVGHGIDFHEIELHTSTQSRQTPAPSTRYSTSLAALPVDIMRKKYRTK